MAEDRTSLRQQIAFGSALLCFVIVAALASGAAYVGRSGAVEAAKTTLKEISMTFADRIDRNIQMRVNTIEDLAAMDPLKPAWLGSRAVVRKLLAEAKDSALGIEWMGFATPDGVVRAAAGGAFEGHSVSHFVWFQRAMGHRTAVAEGGERAITGAPVSPEGTLSRFVDLGVPVQAENGDVIGVLGLYLGRQWLGALRAATIGGFTGGNAIEVRVFKLDGSSALREGVESLSPATLREMLAHSDGVVPQVDANGYIAGYATAIDPDGRGRWLVVTRQLAADAYRTADRVVLTIIALGALLGALGFLLAMLIAARVSRPFRALAEGVGDVGPGSAELPPRARGSREAVSLSAALRDLVLRLSSAQRDNLEATWRAADVERRMNEDIALLRSIAETDMLSQLQTRRAFMDYAREATEQFRSSARPFAILMIDIDEFKRINDRMGHIAGDVVIRSVAATIRGALRPTDRAARFGGEEFIVLLREMSAEKATEAAERIRARIASEPIDTTAGPIAVTVSVGVAIFEGMEGTIDELVERADTALYSAKAAGRDRVVVAPSRDERLRA